MLVTLSSQSVYLNLLSIRLSLKVGYTCNFSPLSGLVALVDLVAKVLPLTL